MMKKIVEWHIPLRTCSEANTREHWTKKKKRHDAQKRAVRLFYNNNSTTITLPVHIKLTRIAPRNLDVFDNLPASFKCIVDCLCDLLVPRLKPGRADNDERITLSCDQKKGDRKQYGIIVNFYDTSKKYVSDVDCLSD